MYNQFSKRSIDLILVFLVGLAFSACSAPATQQDAPTLSAVETSAPTNTTSPQIPTETAFSTATHTTASPTATSTSEPTVEPTATVAPTDHPNSMFKFKGPIVAGGIYFFPSGDEVLLFKDPQFVVLQVADGSQTAAFSAPVRVTDFDISPDGSKVAVASFNDDTGSADIQIYDAATGEGVLLSQAAHKAVVQGLKYSPDGSRILSAGDTTLKVWDAASGSLLKTINAQSFDITCMAISGDGKFMVSGSLGTDKEVKVWTNGGELVATVAKNNTHCYAALFSPDNRWLLTYTGEKMSLYQASDWSRAWQVDYSQANSPFVGFVPDGHFYLGDRRGNLELRDAASQASTWTFAMGPTAAFDFSPDGTVLVVARPNGMVEFLQTDLVVAP